MADVIRITWDGALDDTDVQSLSAGDAVELTGPLFTVRDASAALLEVSLSEGRQPPFRLEGQLLYAAGPSPPKPGQIVGSAGPTTTARLERYLPTLLAAGVRGVVGKGELHGALAASFFRHRAVYLAAIGGLGALLSKRIIASHVMAYPGLGPEAVFRFDVVDFPVVVIIDSRGGNFHEMARARWRRSGEGA